MKKGDFIARADVPLTEEEKGAFCRVVSVNLRKFFGGKMEVERTDWQTDCLYLKWHLEKPFSTEFYYWDRKSWHENDTRKLRNVSFLHFACSKHIDVNGDFQYSLSALPSDGDYQMGKRKRWQKRFQNRHNYRYDTEIEGFAVDVQEIVRDYCNVIPTGTEVVW